jgi:hypothetical protein
MFDNRKPSAGAAIAWAAALHDIPFDDDAIAAVDAFYGTNTHAINEKFDPTKRRWIEPNHVRYHRQKIRSERISTTNALYAGRPDETGAESAHALRALNTAAADGHIPRKAIESSNGVDAEGRGRAILHAIGRETLSSRPEFAAPCPHCAAPAGRPCVNAKGEKRLDAHPTRIEASALVRAGADPIQRDEAQAEMERRRAAARAALAASGPSTFVPPGRNEASTKTEAAS